MKDPMILFARILTSHLLNTGSNTTMVAFSTQSQKDFTAQTSDPAGKGTGGDSIYKEKYLNLHSFMVNKLDFFGDEIQPDLKHSKKGTFSMASAGGNLNASKVFIEVGEGFDTLTRINDAFVEENSRLFKSIRFVFIFFYSVKHTYILNNPFDDPPKLAELIPQASSEGKPLDEVFGEVAEGFDTLTRINEAFVDESSRPFKNIRVKHTYILDDPFDTPPQLAELIPQASPDGKPPDEIDDVRLEDDWVPSDETVDPEQLEESMCEKEAHSMQLSLKWADIIRDYKTGDSLCYVFIGECHLYRV
ncbi:Peptidyl-prolyl cis-trans isomerase [Nymphaea thermarum]|nr:Peptidyl-prolyl cis-trans isomerase [Nymphaea thermarum]